MLQNFCRRKLKDTKGLSPYYNIVHFYIYFPIFYKMYFTLYCYIYQIVYSNIFEYNPIFLYSYIIFIIIIYNICEKFS